MSYQNPSGSFKNEAHGGPVTVVNPASGATIRLQANQVDLYVINGAALAALTVLLPQVQYGQKVEIGSQSAITALTIQDRMGNAIATAPTAGTAGQSVTMRYLGAGNGWVRWK